MLLLRRSSRLAYLIAAIGSVVVVAIHAWLPAPHDSFFAGLGFVATVMLAGGLGGWKPGLAATVLMLLGVELFVIEQQFTSVGEFRRIVSFSVLGVSISALCEGLHRAWARVADRQRRLEEEIVIRRRAELSEQEKAEQLRVTLASIGDAVIATDASGNVTYLNNVAESLTGWELNDVCGRPLESIFNIVNEQSREPVDNPVAKVIRDGRILGLANHTVLIARDGTERPIDDSAAPIRDKTGVVVGVVMIFRDVSEHRLAQSLLRQSEEQFRSLSACSPVGVFLTDTRGHCTYTNPRCQAICGFTFEEALGEGWRRFVHPADRPRAIEDWSDAVAQGGQLDADYRFRHRGGDVCWTHLRMAPMLSDENQPIGYVGTVEDITQRTHSDELMRDSELRYRLIAEAANDAIWDWDIPSNCVSWTEGVRKLFGHVAETASDTTWWYDNIHPDDRVRIVNGIQAVLHGTGDFWSSEYRFRRSDGTYATVFDRARLVRDERGQPARMVGSLIDLTARKQVEDALIRQAANLREQAELLDQAHDAILVCNPAGEITFWNRGAESMYGWLRGEALGENINALLKTEWPVPQAEIEEILQRDGRWEGFLTRTRNDGVQRIVASRLTLRKETPDREGIVLEITSDVTAHRRAEEELRASRDRLELAQVAGRVGTFDWNIQSAAVEWSISGGESAEAGLQHFAGNYDDWMRSVHDEDREAVLEQLQQVVREKSDVKFRFRMLRPDGSTRWIEAQGKVFADHAGRPLRMVGVNVDVTEQHQHTQRLQLLWETAGVLLSTDNTRTILDGLFAKIGAPLNLDAYFNLMLNETGETLRLESFGGSATEAISQAAGEPEAWQQLAAGVGLTSADDLLKNFARDLGLRAYVSNPLVAGGRMLGSLSFGSRTRDAFGAEELEFLRTIAHYVTLAHQRGRLMRELQDSARRKDQFLATLAHELRNPLAPISNALQLWPLVENDPAETKRLHEMMQRQVQQIIRLIDDLLDVSRITRGKIQLRKQTVELATVLEGAVEGIRPFIEGCRHQLTVSLPKEAIEVDGDIARLVQVFSNILHNAAKYSGRGGDIRVSAEWENGQAVARIRDNGPGIPQHMLADIFEMFIQVDQTLERAQGGLGIGLTLVKTLVELHGGTVEAHSAGLGKGSEFVVRLPVVAAASQPVLPRAPHDALRWTVGMPSHKILVVDDVSASAKTLGMMLAAIGQDVSVRMNGAAAIEAALADQPRIAFIDIAMPGMSGYDVAKAFKSNPDLDDVVLVALTGYGQEEDRRMAFESGFDHHMVKPASIDGLAQIVLNVPAATMQE